MTVMGQRFLGKRLMCAPGWRGKLSRKRSVSALSHHFGWIFDFMKTLLLEGNAVQRAAKVLSACLKTRPVRPACRQAGGPGLQEVEIPAVSCRLRALPPSSRSEPGLRRTGTRRFGGVFKQVLSAYLFGAALSLALPAGAQNTSIAYDVPAGTLGNQAIPNLGVGNDLMRPG
jgi:hypothetical protein